jgi:TM2 domain-containing membrane protein YozV
MATQLKKCQNCGTENSGYETFCRNCGTMLSSSYQNQQVQPSSGAGLQQQQLPGADKKLLAGLMGILFGGFGVHKFILGYTTEGLIQIAITVVTCGIGSIIGLIEGIIYLTKSDQEFVDTYIRNKKGWF